MTGLKHVARTVALIGLLLVAAATASAQSVEILFLASGNPIPLQNLMRDILAPAFEAETGIKVHYEHVNWNNRSERITLLQAGGLPPDVVSTGAASVYEETTSGLLAPITEYIEKWEVRDLIPPPIWNALAWGQDTYIVPQWFDIRGIAYNKAAFANGGMDLNRAPDGWDQLIDYARKLTRLDSDGATVVQRGFAFQYNMVQNLVWFIAQAGGSPIDLAPKRSNLNSPEALAALNALLDLARAGQRNLAGPNASGIASGTVAITFADPTQFGGWPSIHPSAAEDIVVFPARRSPQLPPVAINFINGLAITSASTKKDEAWQWIAYLYRDDVQRQIHSITGWVSPRLDLAGELLFSPGLEYFYDLVPYSWSAILPPPREQSVTEFVPIINEVLSENMSSEEALLRGHELWSRLMQEWNF